MSKKSVAAFFLILFLIGYGQTVSPPRSPEAILADYRKADKLYESAEKISLSASYDEKKEQELNRSSLRLFEGLCNELASQSPKYDSLLFHCLFKMAVIQHYFDSTSQAKTNYLKSLQLKEKYKLLPDSFCFKPLIYLGGILYTESQFDSARNYYRQAERIAASYPVRLSESERLLNTLGALYFEAGNYTQAKKYFLKAINSVSLTGEAAKTLTVNYKINLAATYTKLEDYENAGKIYDELTDLTINQNEVLHNTGFIRHKTGKPEEALRFFRKVHYENKNIIRLYNDISQVFAGLGKEDSALYYLQLAVAENNKWNKTRKNLQYGLTLRYLGDLHYKNGDYTKALASYQLSAIQFTPGFDDENIYTNPGEFSGIFSYINLFLTLCAKADSFEKLYHQDNNTETLNAAFAAYQSAFRLAGYVEQTYNSDEARLFIGKIKHDVHTRPIDIGIKLFKITRNKDFLEQVYLFDQRNKASILSLNNKLQQITEAGAEKDEVFRKKSVIQSSITRLSLKSAGITDSTELASISASIRDLEIELGKVNEEINSDPARMKMMAAEKIPSVNQLHRKLDNTSAILSYHLSENDLLILIITAGQFEYKLVPINKHFYNEIDNLKKTLHHHSSEQRYGGTAAASWLWQQLIAPAQSSLSQIKRLIIIPDDELNYLPFEVLQDPGKRYLFEKFSIQYQYSTALLGSNSGNSVSQSILSFAPFTSNGYADSLISLSRLPASSDEIKDLTGQSLSDTAATKNNFLRYANHNTVVHLATHASVNNDDPLRSYISFYPGNNESRLYAQEIYDLRLDTTNLIILSACETGSGQLVKGEGLMSLSRAFAYAGCPNIITSLWKAEDRTTAFIAQRLHFYLTKKETKDKALQLAKIDLLNNPDIDPAMKTPNYWAHLVLIGEYEPDHKRSNWPWVAIGIVTILLAYYYTKKRKSLPSFKDGQA